MTVHASHPDIIKRLKRAAGHLKSTIQMLEDEKACLDIAQQLHAVEKAITNAKRTLIHDHLDHCRRMPFMLTTRSLIRRLANLKR